MAADLETRVTGIETRLTAMGAALGANTPITILPADLLNLANWKLTLPYRDPSTGNAEEITQPELSTFDDGQFRANPNGPGVLCRVFHGDAGVTKKSLNPRTELREMFGSKLAAWIPAGTHLLSSSLAVVRQTPVKPHNVLGQIHDDDDDVCTWRLEGGTLYRTLGDDAHNAIIAKNVALGDRLNLSFLVSGGMIRTFFNGAAAPVPDLKVPNGAHSWYFRTGNYLQSNAETAPAELTSSYSDVILYDVSVFHG